jgi:hypothetical protein
MPDRGDAQVDLVPDQRHALLAGLQAGVGHGLLGEVAEGREVRCHALDDFLPLLLRDRRQDREPAGAKSLQSQKALCRRMTSPLGLVSWRPRGPVVVQRLNQAIVKPTRDNAFRAQFEAIGLVMAPPLKPLEFEAFIACERAVWGPLIKAKNIHID